MSQSTSEPANLPNSPTFTIDTTAPVVTLSGSSTVTMSQSGVFSDSGASWTDLVDGAGDILNFNSGTLDVNTVGTYVVHYEYTDAAGNTGSVSRTVDVVAPDVIAPVVTLSGTSTVNQEYGSPYVEVGAEWTDNLDGAGNTFGGTYGSTGSFQFSGSVNHMAI